MPFEPTEHAHTVIADHTDDTKKAKVTDAAAAATDPGIVVHVATQPVSGGGGGGQTDAEFAARLPLPVTDNGGSLTVDGTVSVNNLPATQPVSGTVTVANPTTNPETGLAKDATFTARLPTTLDADGGMKTHVQNFPASQAVTGPLTDTQLRAGAVPVSLASVPSHAVTGPLTDAQLRAVAVPVSGTFWQATQPVSGTVTANAGTGTMAVSGPLTDVQLRAAAVPVSGPLTDTQLRAAAVPVSLASVPSHAVTGPLTNTELRATPVPISGTVAIGSATTPTFKGRACSFINPGRAGTTGQNLLSLFNAVGSTKVVRINGIAIDLYQTVVKAVTVAPPMIRVYRVTALPTGGVAVAKGSLDTALTSNALITTLGDANSDTVVATTPLAAVVAASGLLTQEAAPRFVGTAAAGYEMFDRAEFFNDSEVVLRAGEGIVLRLHYTLATQNPVTDMWTSVVMWTEE
jgi:hypothetical protein